MAESKTVARAVRHGIEMTEAALEEHHKAFSDMEKCFEYLDKQQLSLLTKSKKRDRITEKKQTKEKPVCQENRSNTRKKQSKK